MDVFAEAEGLKRRRALLERMQQQAANPAIQGPRKYAIAQLLASLATQQQASRGLKGIDSAESANREQYGTELGSEMERYIGRQEGDPGAPQLPGAPAVPEVAPGMPGLPAMPAVSAINPTAPQPRRAVFDAIASRYPEMQAVGKAGMAEMLRKPPAPPKPDNWSMAPDGTPYRTGPNGEFITRSEKFPGKPMVNIDNYPDHARMLEVLFSIPHLVAVDATRLAHAAGTIKAQNTVVLGAATPLLPLPAEAIEAQLQALFEPKGDRIVQANLRAFRKGHAACGFVQALRAAGVPAARVARVSSRLAFSPHAVDADLVAAWADRLLGPHGEITAAQVFAAPKLVPLDAVLAVTA